MPLVVSCLIEKRNPNCHDSSLPAPFVLPHQQAIAAHNAISTTIGQPLSLNNKTAHEKLGIRNFFLGI